MPATLLKRWQDWSAGVGYPIDDGTPGMHTSNKLLGLRGELRPAPAATDVAVATDPGHHYQYFFEEPVSAGQTPVFDAGSNGNASSSKTITVSHTVADNDNRLLLAGVFSEEAIVATSVTYGGVELDLLFPGRMIIGSGAMWVYYLRNPAVGTANIVFTFAAAQTTALVLASSWYKVDQTGPFGGAYRANADGDAGPATVDATSASGEIVVDFAGCTENDQTMTVGAGQTEATGAGGVASGDLRAGMSYENGAATTTMSWSLGAATKWKIWSIPLIGIKPGPSYLYAQRGKKSGSSSPVKVDKVSLSNADFANLETGAHELVGLTVPGQSVRYKGYWWYPMGDNQKARRLQTVGVGAVSNDTLDATAAQLGADHFASLGAQVAATLEHSGNDDGGMRILKVAGDIGTEADWGPAFEAGDRTERAAGLSGLGGLSFVFGVDGLYSFNKSARARLIFEDFRSWRHVFSNTPIVPYKGGLAFSHPTGLLYFVPGNLPVNIGLTADVGRGILAPSGPPELRGGRYHGLAVAGNFLYNIYQPDISSTTVNIMVSYPRENSPYDLIHQQLGTTTLQDADHMLGCFVSVSSKPRSAEYVTPTLWYGDDDDLAYKILGTDASPFRTRTDIHAVETAGDTYMSELLFERPTELSHLVIYPQNMVSGDEWQIKAIADGEEETNLGPPIKGNGRHPIKIDREVYRLMLHVNWASTVSTARVAPSIQRIELYGPTPVTGRV